MRAALSVGLLHHTSFINKVYMSENHFLAKELMTEI